MGSHHTERGQEPIDAFLRAAHLVGPHQVAGLLRRHAAALGVTDAVAYLADLQQTVLVPLVEPAGPGLDRQLTALGVDSTVAGRCYQHVEVVVQQSTTDGVRVWLPLLDGAERLGVLGVTVAAAADLGSGRWDADDPAAPVRRRRRRSHHVEDPVRGHARPAAPPPRARAGGRAAVGTAAAADLRLPGSDGRRSAGAGLRSRRRLARLRRGLRQRPVRRLRRDGTRTAQRPTDRADRRRVPQRPSRRHVPDRHQQAVDGARQHARHPGSSPR